MHHWQVSLVWQLSCCTSGCNVRGCYCDRACHVARDCCADIDQICPGMHNCGVIMYAFKLPERYKKRCEYGVYHTSWDGKNNPVQITFLFNLKNEQLTKYFPISIHLPLPIYLATVTPIAKRTIMCVAACPHSANTYRIAGKFGGEL